MAEVQLNLDSSILEEIIDKSRDRFDMADTPTRVRNLLDYFDATEPRTIL